MVPRNTTANNFTVHCTIKTIYHNLLKRTLYLLTYPSVSDRKLRCVLFEPMHVCHCAFCLRCADTAFVNSNEMSSYFWTATQRSDLFCCTSARFLQIIRTVMYRLVVQEHILRVCMDCGAWAVPGCVRQSAGLSPLPSCHNSSASWTN